MTLDDKKRFVIEYIRLGMDPEDSFIAAECTADEEERLAADPDFALAMAREERKAQVLLLSRVEDCMKVNTLKGNSTEARWLLEKRSSKYGNRQVTLTMEPSIDPPIITVLEKGKGS